MTAQGVTRMSEDAMYEEIFQRYLQGQEMKDMAAELNLPERQIRKFYQRVKAAVTVADYSLPPGVQEQTTLAYLNMILMKQGESSDPLANKVALGAVAMIQKHPLVRASRAAAEPDWGKVRDIGGEVTLDGLLEPGAEDEKE